MQQPPLGLWLDGLAPDVRAGLKEAQAWRAEAVALDGLGAEINPRALSGTGRRDLAHRVRAAGLEFAALRADVGGRRLADPKTLDASLGRISEVFRLARDAGARRVLVPLGFVPPKERAAEAQPLREAIQALAALASTAGVVPAVPAGGEAPEDLAALLDAADASRLFEVDLNPGALAARGVDPLAALAVLQARVGLATVTDYYRGGREAPFGKGDVPWGEVLVGLATLPRGPRVPLLAASEREEGRAAHVKLAHHALIALRRNPLGRPSASKTP